MLICLQRNASKAGLLWKVHCALCGKVPTNGGSDVEWPGGEEASVVSSQATNLTPLPFKCHTALSTPSWEKNPLEQQLSWATSQASTNADTVASVCEVTSTRSQVRLSQTSTFVAFGGGNVRSLGHQRGNEIQETSLKTPIVSWPWGGVGC